MKIKKFVLRRFRAFDTQTIIPLSDFTVLVGPNNLGKSTILRALNVFFGAFHRGVISLSRLSRTYRYDADNDYPKRWEGKSGRRWPTQMSCVLELTQTESNSLADLIPVTFEVNNDQRQDN